MNTFAIKQWFSSGLFHQDPLKKEAKRELRQLENDCYVVLDRILDHCIFEAERGEELHSEAQTFRREAEEFFKAGQFARAKMEAQKGNSVIRLAMLLPFQENSGLFF